MYDELDRRRGLITKYVYVRARAYIIYVLFNKFSFITIDEYVTLLLAVTTASIA